MNKRSDFLQSPVQSERDRPRGWIYRELGVEPFIQCAGVRTNYGASNPSDEVISAMDAAAAAFVDMDELAEAVGQRMAALTGAEWGVITAGTAASLSLATAACIAGNNPELMLRLPDTAGLRNKVLIPVDQRFPYEQAIRIAGAEIVGVSTMAELALALDGKVAMICLLGRADDASALPLSSLLPFARAHGVCRAKFVPSRFQKIVTRFPKNHESISPISKRSRVDFDEPCDWPRPFHLPTAKVKKPRSASMPTE